MRQRTKRLTHRVAQLQLRPHHLRPPKVLTTQRPSASWPPLKRYLATRTDHLPPWLFLSERGAPITRQEVNYLSRRAGAKARVGRVWPHMLRHACGYYLANSGVDLRTAQDYLGHRDPKHTVRYTRVAGRRFEGLWR